MLAMWQCSVWLASAWSLVQVIYSIVHLLSSVNGDVAFRIEGPYETPPTLTKVLNFTLHGWDVHSCS